MFFPGSYQLKSTVIIRGKVQRLVGVGGMIDYFGNAKPDFRIVDGESDVLTSNTLPMFMAVLKLTQVEPLFFEVSPTAT